MGNTFGINLKTKVGVYDGCNRTSFDDDTISPIRARLHTVSSRLGGTTRISSVPRLQFALIKGRCFSRVIRMFKLSITKRSSKRGLPCCRSCYWFVRTVVRYCAHSHGVLSPYRTFSYVLRCRASWTVSMCASSQCRLTTTLSKFAIKLGIMLINPAIHLLRLYAYAWNDLRDVVFVGMVLSSGALKESVLNSSVYITAFYSPFHNFILNPIRVATLLYPKHIE